MKDKLGFLLEQYVIWLGAMLFTGGGGGGQSSTTIQQIPDELKPLATEYAGKAIDLSKSGFTPYSGDRYSDLNQTQNTGIGMIQDRALGGSDTMRNAEGSLNQFIRGDNTNPYLDSMVNKAQSSVARNFNTMVKPQTEAAMRQGGSFGNSGFDAALGNQQIAAAGQMGDIANSMYGNAYGINQANKMQAIGMSPTFGNAAYNDANQLMKAGQIQQDESQKNLDFGYNQFQEGQNKPYKDLAAMSGVFGSNLGGQSSTSSIGGGK